VGRYLVVIAVLMAAACTATAVLVVRGRIRDSGRDDVVLASDKVVHPPSWGKHLPEKGAHTTPDAIVVKQTRDAHGRAQVDGVGRRGHRRHPHPGGAADGRPTWERQGNGCSTSEDLGLEMFLGGSTARRVPPGSQLHAAARPPRWADRAWGHRPSPREDDEVINEGRGGQLQPDGVEAINGVQRFRYLNPGNEKGVARHRHAAPREAHHRSGAAVLDDGHETYLPRTRRNLALLDVKRPRRLPSDR